MNWDDISYENLRSGRTSIVIAAMQIRNELNEIYELNKTNALRKLDTRRLFELLGQRAVLYSNHAQIFPEINIVKTMVELLEMYPSKFDINYGALDFGPII